MSDPLVGIVHSAEQPTFEALREQFREENRQRVHRMLREETITFRNADGTYLRDVDGNVVRRKTGYLTDAPPGRDHRRLDEARTQGQVVPEFTSDFCIERDGRGDLIADWRGLDHELRDLQRDAAAMAESERVAHPEVESLEGPPLAALDDASVLDYVDNILKETNGPEATCSPEASGSGTAPATDST